MPEKVLRPSEQESANTSTLPPGKYKVVTWDLDTTGRKLVDEICHVGGYYSSQDSGCDGEGSVVYSQYVMPHRNPNPGARRSFGIRVVNFGRYRMLKDAQTGEVLKTKSEVSALQEFVTWLEGLAPAKEGQEQGILLASHEQDKRILAPLLLQALEKYNLLVQFSAVVKGFCNIADVISGLEDKTAITSLSLRSLCKTVLADTSLSTTTATHRSQRSMEILGKLAGEEPVSALVYPHTKTIQEEQAILSKMKQVIGKQDTLRPIFGSQLNQNRHIRERALNIRRHVAEADLDYKRLQEAFTNNSLPALLERVQLASEEEQERMVTIILDHFNQSVKPAVQTANKDEPAPVKKQPVKGVDSTPVKPEPDTAKPESATVQPEPATVQPAASE